jgi:hypothetical protein
LPISEFRHWRAEPLPCPRRRFLGVLCVGIVSLAHDHGESALNDQLVVTCATNGHCLCQWTHWGDTYAGVEELAFEALQYSEGRPNERSRPKWPNLKPLPVSNFLQL